MKNWILWRAPTNIDFNIFCSRFAHVFYLLMSTKQSVGFFLFCLEDGVLYFEDGVRKIDLIIAYKNCSDENENRAKNETRQRFLPEIQESGLQIEEVYNYNSKKKTRNTLVTFFFNSSFLEH